MPTVTPNYGTYQAITIGLASVATSSTLVAGQESNVIDNTSDKFDDVKVAGKITVGTTPTAGTQIVIYVFERLDNTPTYPDVMDGTDSVETLTSVGVGRGFLTLAKVLDVDAATSNVAYAFSFSVAQLFGGRIPDFWSIFVAHNTGVNLHATAGNHVLKYQGLKFDIA